MSFNTYTASAPIFTAALGNMRAWLDKAVATKPEAELMVAKLADDMRPFSAQFQIASDGAKGAIARLADVTAPSMPNTEASFADLKARLDKTIAFINSVDPAAIAVGADRAIQLKFPNGMGYYFTGADFLTKFALPNFMFHGTTAYAILRAEGVPMDKPDFLQHLGQPVAM